MDEILRMYRAQPWSLVSPVASLLALILLLCDSRTRATFGIASVALLALSCEVAPVFFKALAATFSSLEMFDAVVESFILVALAWLLFYLTYRFIFGLTSRCYYGLADRSESPEA